MDYGPKGIRSFRNERHLELEIGRRNFGNVLTNTECLGELDLYVMEVRYDFRYGNFFTFGIGLGDLPAEPMRLRRRVAYYSYVANWRKLITWNILGRRSRKRQCEL
jgi:hypothetical protein